MDDLMPIGAFSERSGLSPKRLRNYAAEGLLVPAAVDSGSGYRYYSPGQLRDAELIGVLRALDIPLADIARFLRDPSAEFLDVWAGRVESDAGRRRAALDRAWALLALEGWSDRETENEREGAERMTGWSTASRVDIGRVRDSNEDVAEGTDHLAAVADGIGGLPGGSVASAVAVAVVDAAFTGRSLDELQAGARVANRTIWDRPRSTSDPSGMGTTLLPRTAWRRARRRELEPAIGAVDAFVHSLTDTRPNADGTVLRGSTPPGYCSWFGLHTNAKLTPAQRQRLAAGLRATLGPGRPRRGRD